MSSSLHFHGNYSWEVGHGLSQLFPKHENNVGKDYDTLLYFPPRYLGAVI